MLLRNLVKGQSLLPELEIVLLAEDYFNVSLKYMDCAPTLAQKTIARNELG